ncbi:hypothetical protein XHV734_0095 [Xanthomonas hortorum pv. vitians]|nr:hypothetical protein XHV734_0095 [Xanthomonas hortorum pv. vitians]
MAPTPAATAWPTESCCFEIAMSSPLLIELAAKQLFTIEMQHNATFL